MQDKKIVLFSTSENKLVELDKNERVLYFEYLEFDKYIGMFENLFGVSDALRDNLITVDKDNIHLYYEFMSDEDIIKNIDILNDVFTKRYFQIRDYFIENDLVNTGDNKKDHELLQYSSKYFKNPFRYYELSFFNTKDTLKPIDEYIEEIKASSEYKEYIVDSVIKYFSDTYGKEKETVLYDYDLELKEGIKRSKINTPFGTLYTLKFSPVKKGENSHTFIRIKGL